ncbi:hypothetical protein [Pseudooceanicola nanhaiensis]|uniref:hypothetical protein n=1 Tax=Pseudooceanicola nanhaiensis TaxID=375761 RepID=UPI001CD54484|nr:hypothetical protein [Pseudooceanicola nanhaiensis]MCA0922778.1 hypothetical protein [Pseudooceanicola nanhaiensis]
MIPQPVYEPGSAAALQATVLVSSARFGASYFIDIYRKVFEDALVLNEIFRKDTDNLNVLSDLLGQPRDEVRKQANEDPVGFWSAVKAAVADRGVPVIAKAYYYHKPTGNPLWGAVAREDHVIHLVRRNLFEAYLSRLIAQKTGKWWRNLHDEAAPDDLLVEVDRKDVERYISARRKEIVQFRNLFTGANYHEIVFEDVIRSPLRCARAVTDMYDLPKGIVEVDKIRPSFQRMKQRSNADVVSNYGEVADLDRLEVF